MNQDIKDIKLPLDIPNQWAWIWIVLLVLLVVIGLVFLILWLRKRPQPEPVIPIPQISAWEKALARLDNLKSKKLMERAYLKPFYSELGDILRHYIEERFLLKAPEMTTEEFLDSLKTSEALNDKQKQCLKDFLYSCDLVKFAKHESNESEALKTFDLAKQLVDETRGI